MTPGTRVQTALGKGIVREVRNNGRVLVDVQGRSLVLESRNLRVLTEDERPSGRTRRVSGTSAPQPATATRTPGALAGPATIREVDLHGLTVEAAVARVDDLLDCCMRDDVAQLRVIHGRGGGRLRAAVHRHLAGIPSVRAFALDPHNPGVTNVFL